MASAPAMIPIAKSVNGRAPDRHADTSSASRIAVSRTAAASLFTYPAVNANCGRNATASAPHAAMERAWGKSFRPIQNVRLTVPRYDARDTYRAGHIDALCVSQPATADRMYASGGK